MLSVVLPVVDALSWDVAPGAHHVVANLERHDRDLLQISGCNKKIGSVPVVVDQYRSIGMLRIDSVQRPPLLIAVPMTVPMWKDRLPQCLFVNRLFARGISLHALHAYICCLSAVAACRLKAAPAAVEWTP